jgi:hypothetical protein
MNADNNMLVVVGIIAMVVIAALFLAKKVGFKLTNEGVSLSANKNKDKDSVKVKQVQQSTVEVENRPDQNIEVESISGGSDIKIK